MLRAALGVAVAGAALACWARWRRFERFLRSEEQSVRAAAEAPTEHQTLVDLPPPVQRFFQRSVRGDCTGFRLWVARGAGWLRFEPGGAWKDLAAQTVGAVGPEPAFCYTGSLQLGLGRLLPCRGREALLQGRGAMEWRLWGAVRLARNEGGRLNQSALLRWLAEAVCFPPALLPSRHLAWLPASEGEGGGPQRSARAVVRCRGAQASALLTFDGEGRFLELVSEDYWRVLPGGGLACAPWRARSVGAVGHFDLPGGASVEAATQLEAAWLEPDGSEFVHIRFSVDSLQAE